MTAEFTHADRKDGIRRTVLILVAIIVVLVGLFFNRVFTPRILSPVEMVNNGAEDRNNRKDDWGKASGHESF